MDEKQHFMACAFSPQQLVDAIMRAERGMAVLAHELRDPLSVISMCLEEINAACAVNSEVVDIHQIARDAAAQMARLIEDVLELCRVNRGVPVNRTERIDLGRIVVAAVRNARAAIGGRGHCLSVLLPPGRVLLDANPTRVQQIVTNLLVNAAKFTEPGGTIALVAEEAGDTLEIRVRDNGIGIAPECLARVFDPYWQQSSDGPNRGGDGLGIGLSLVKSLVEMHGGTVSAHSDGPGRGAEFVVRIPGRVVSDVRQGPAVRPGMTLAECADYAV